MRRTDDLAALFVACALAGTAVTTTNATAIKAAALVFEINPFCIFQSPRLLTKRMLPVRAIQHFLDKLHTLEIQQLGVLLLPPVQRHADFPRARKDTRVFNRRLVLN